MPILHTAPCMLICLPVLSVSLVYACLHSINSLRYVVAAYTGMYMTLETHTLIVIDWQVGRLAGEVAVLSRRVNMH